MRVFTGLFAIAASLASISSAIVSAGQQPAAQVPSTEVITVPTHALRPAVPAAQRFTAASRQSNSGPVTRVVVQRKSAPQPTFVPTVARPLVTGMHPNFNGPTGVVVNSQNFGSAEIRGTAVTMTLQYATPSSTLTVASVANQDFAVTSSSCSVNGCTATVTFTAAYPGVRSDAIIFTDSSGNLVYKTFVYGLGLGPQFGYDLGNDSIYIGFTSSPQNVAIGPDERVYYTSTNGAIIYRAKRDFSSADTITITGLASPSGIVVDGSNTVYIADPTNNVIFTYSALGVQSTLRTSQLSGPSQIAVDGTGALYIADTGNNRIIKIDNQGNETTLASSLTKPVAVAVDSHGNVFFADMANSGEILELAPAASVPTVFHSNLNAVPRNLAIDPSGAIYLTADNGLDVFRMGSTIGYSATGNDVSTGVAVDRNGDLFLTQPLKGNFSVTDRNHSNFILSTAPGTTTSGDVTVANTGNETLNFNAFFLTGTAFAIAPTSTCIANGTLAVDTTCNVTVNFTPPSAMDFNEVLTLTSDSRHAPGSSSPFDLAGHGTGPDTVTAVSTSRNPVQSSTPVTLFVSVKDSSTTFTPTGTVTFLDGKTPLGTATLFAGGPLGTATTQFTVSGLSVGSHSITASYPGDTNVRPSISTPVTLVVTNGPPPPNGGVAVDSKNFGNVNVGQSLAMNLTYAAGTGNLSFNGAQDQDFVVSTVNCSSACVATVIFVPQYPGLRSDVITVTDSSGTTVARTYVYGNGVGPQFGFDNGNTSARSGTVQSPGGIAVDGNGNSFVTDSATNQVYVFNVDYARALPIVNLGTPTGIATDARSILYVADRTHNLIVTYNPNTQQQGTLVTSQLSAPSGVAVDGAGSIYIADSGNKRVIKIDNQGAETALASGITSLGPITVDNLGDVFYATTADPGTIVQLPAGGGQPIQVANNISFIHGIAVDAGGRIYFTNDAGLSILAAPGCNVCSLEGIQLGPGGSAVNGVALAPNGDIYATATNTSQFFTMTRASSSLFIGTNVGSTSKDNFFVANTGNASLTISSAAFTGSAFRFDPTSACGNGTILQAGVACNAVIDFHPTVSGPYHESLTFTSNSLNSASSINVQDLQGTGTAAVSRSTTTTLVANPVTAVPGAPVTLTATVTESTNTPPSGTVTFYDGTNSIGSSQLAFQTSGGSSTAQITTSLLTTGTHSITAVYGGDYNFNSSTSATQTATISGSSAPTITSQNFGPVAVGQTVSMNIVYSQGTNPTISAVNNLDFVVSTVNCTSTCMATISFTPQYPGLRTDAVTVTSSGGTLLAKTFLYGRGTAPQFGFNTGINTSFPSFVKQPTAITLGADGKAFVSDTSTNKVIGITLNQQGPLPINGLITPAGLAIDGSNTLYVADQGSNLVRFYNLVTQTQGMVTTSTLSKPGFLAVDGTGALYIADTGNQRIIRIDNQSVETTVASGLNSPQGVAVDAAGNFYYADANSAGDIVELPAGGGQPSIVATQLGNVGQIAVDASGSIYYVGDFSSVRIVLPSRAVIGPLLGPSGSLSGIALASNGDVYTTQASTGVYAISTRGTTSGSATATVGQTTQEPGLGVINTGNASLTLSSLVFTTGAAFHVDASSACAAGIVLAPGTLCNTLIDFTPPAAQTYSDRLTFTSNSLNAAAATSVDIQNGIGTAASLAASSTTLAASSTTPSIGQAVTFTTTVSDTASITPTGSVSFVDGTTVIGSGSLAAGSAGSASVQFTTSSLGLGSHRITALYPGNSSLSASNSTAQTVTVSQGSTATVLGVSAASITVGQTETLTATITGGISPALSGNVTFFDGTTAIGNANITATSTAATATLSVATLSVGAHSISARYNGDANYTASASTAQTVSVTRINSTATLALSSSAITVGQSETLTSTIQGAASPALTGSVTFFDGTTQLGSSNITVNGATATASFTAPNLAVGSHSITARYSGDTNNTASTTAAQTVTIAQATSSTALSVSAPSITVGQSETLTATVQGLASPALTGSVTFFDGTTQLGSTAVTINGATGTAALIVTTLAAGSHTITARYAGDVNYSGSTSAAQTVTVAQAGTSTALSTSAASISAGQTETLTATVQGLATPAITGTVTFFDGTASLGSASLIISGATGTASLSTSTLSGGSHSIFARYAGDANYAGSASGVQTVNVVVVTQTITFPAIPSHMFGDAPFTLAATASSNLPVSYTILSGPATVSGSTVTLTGAGTVSIQATQAGNAIYGGTTPVTQTFNVATPTPVLASIAPASAVVGAPATTITLTGTNFAATDTVQVNGTAVGTTFVSATSLTAVIPASVLATAGTAQVRVFDASNTQTTSALAFTILAAPAINFSGPTTTAPAQQPTLTFQLVNPYPVPITGTLTLTFTPQSSALTDDPAVQFAAGGRTLTFTIPANSQTTPSIQLQSGTVAGRVTITLTVTANGVNVTPTNVVPVVITIPAAVPAVSSAGLARSGKTLTVTVQGYSNTRELTTALFHFTAANGSSISDPDIKADVTSAFATWFASVPSAQYGSTFTYTQVFNLSDDASTIGSVTVTLVNSIGNSTVGTAQ